ncbi:hypothetical protein PMAYCL1PPCAC_09282, partial [Pristionchus mayeri]
QMKEPTAPAMDTDAEAPPSYEQCAAPPPPPPVVRAQPVQQPQPQVIMVQPTYQQPAAPSCKHCGGPIMYERD